VIRAHDAREQKRLARIGREEGWDEYADEWDGFIDERVVTPPKIDPEVSETG
jgi:hypothetical protein